MLEFQVEFLKTLEDGTRLVPDLEKLERVEEFKVCPSDLIYINIKHSITQSVWSAHLNNKYYYATKFLGHTMFFFFWDV